ncbi:MAG: hypothetical protein JWP78_1531 [Mucilaginibacter sp.]|nr:hypothetical protein [Mucilaginibacter sp.]
MRELTYLIRLSSLVVSCKHKKDPNALFRPERHQTTPHYLLDDVLETDDSGYFRQPFEALGKLMKFSIDLKS